MKALLILIFPCCLSALEFQKFGGRELGAQVTAGAVGAGIGYLFLQSSVADGLQPESVSLTAVQTLAGLSLGYTLGILFSGKLFQGRGNPFLTLVGNLVPFAGPLVAYHLSAGSHGFSESLALFNLNGEKLSLGLPIPYRKMTRYDQPGEALYYLNLAIINL